MLKFIRTYKLYALIAPYLLWACGFATNETCIIVNSGKFPVMVNSRWLADNPADSDGMMDSVHAVMTNKSHLAFLGDVFRSHDGISSVGDFMIEAGDGLKDFMFPIWGFLLFLELKKQRDRGSVA